MLKRKYLYVFKCKDLPIWKIGYSAEPGRRCNSLFDGCPFDLDIWCTHHTILYMEEEKYLHGALSNYRIKGEWYNVPEHILCEIFRNMPMLHTDIGAPIAVYPGCQWFADHFPPGRPGPILEDYYGELPY